ncbi:PREDICTED: uncharacterized protein LOC107165824 [Diuraphis noxia]|uniref:uncharacterized protein LOC107165824 n=1 Tax=Diuraphis noxia TaxID=143948 RepID=UPI000763B8BA|nr:PREDICTED: uncharacterized protein LOC107165824 [Diuraphis noxia]
MEKVITIGGGVMNGRSVTVQNYTVNVASLHTLHFGRSVDAALPVAITGAVAKKRSIFLAPLSTPTRNRAPRGRVPRHRSPLIIRPPRSPSSRTRAHHRSRSERCRLLETTGSLQTPWQSAPVVRDATVASVATTHLDETTFDINDPPPVSSYGKIIMLDEDLNKVMDNFLSAKEETL